MDFSAAQDQARRTSKKLVLLFLMSVLSLIIITNLLVAVALLGFDVNFAGSVAAGNSTATNLMHYLSLERFGKIALAVCGVVGCAIAYKWIQLSGGGKRVAEQLGGQRIHPNTNNIDEKRVLNVVEEMAIASGMPVPPVYLLAHEAGINAFAAGNTPADAVIGVTRGSVEQFDRDQLQGVIAHEFSHILNGDMRINIRLIAILHGIVFIGLVGEILMRGGSRSGYSSSRRSQGNQLALLGLGLMMVGWLGRFFGNWIKSAVSRQREYLADASAVQFTRNPTGLAEALKIIGGYTAGAQLQSTQASEMRHLFFGSVIKKVGGFFATHPPLDHRISLIEPDWDGKYIQRKIKPAYNAAEAEAKRQEEQQRREKLILGTVIAAGAVAQRFGSQESLMQLQQALGDASVSIADQLNDPLGAMALVSCVLLSPDRAVADKQREGIALVKVQGLSALVEKLYPEVIALGREQQLPVIELAIPTLKTMSQPQYKTFKRLLLLLVRADRKLDLFEWCVYELLRHYLDPEFAAVRPSKPRYNKIEQLADAYQIVLSTLFHYGSNASEEGERAFTRGANTAGLYNTTLLPVSQCTLDKFTDAVDRLANAYPLLKPRLIKGLCDCAQHDGKIDPVEREIITAIAAVMDSPQPKL